LVNSSVSIFLIFVDPQALHFLGLSNGQTMRTILSIIGGIKKKYVRMAVPGPTVKHFSLQS